jgi:aldose 1-epimerase
LIDVTGTGFDLRRPVALGALNLDHVFTGSDSDQPAQVIYQPLGLSVQLVVSSDFSHFVLYAPAGAEFFCLESQTCSTDAHNLYSRNYRQESGLKFVPAGGVHSGSVFYSLKWRDK